MTYHKNAAYTEAELIGDNFIPALLTLEEEEESNAALTAFRLQGIEQMTDDEKLYYNLLTIQHQIRFYLEQRKPTEYKSFSSFLELYIKILGKKQVDFAAEISLHPTKLNQILKNKITPNLALIYRLEKHSGGLIDALLWWKLVAKKTELDIKNDTQNRDIEARKVHFALAF